MSPTTTRTYPKDEPLLEERMSLMDEKGKPFPETTKFQLQRYFQRRKAIMDAAAFTYTNDVTCKNFVDELIYKGAEARNMKGYRSLVMELVSTEGIATRFDRKVEMDYISTLFEVNGFERNYRLNDEL